MKATYQIENGRQRLNLHGKQFPELTVFLEQEQIKSRISTQKQIERAKPFTIEDAAKAAINDFFNRPDGKIEIESGKWNTLVKEVELQTKLTEIKRIIIHVRDQDFRLILIEKK